MKRAAPLLLALALVTACAPQSRPASHMVPVVAEARPAFRFDATPHVELIRRSQRPGRCCGCRASSMQSSGTWTGTWTT